MAIIIIVLSLCMNNADKENFTLAFLIVLSQDLTPVATIRTYKREAPYRMLQSAQGLKDEAAFCVLSFLFSAVLLPASYR